MGLLALDQPSLRFKQLSLNLTRSTISILQEINMSSSDDDQKDSHIVFNRHSNTPSAKPKSHRCNEHLEDVLNGISTWPMDFSKPFGVFWKCLRSQPGK